jgi:site-specific recombinase XerD
MELYRRHVKSCQHRKKGVGYTRCNCPVWVDGKHPTTGARLKRSLETRDWARGQKMLQDWERSLRDGGTITTTPTVAKAASMYLESCREENKAESTLKSYGNVLEHFVAGCIATDISTLSIAHISVFRTQRTNAAGHKGEKLTPRTIRKELEHIRTFCEYCVTQGWMTTNPARKVKAPKDHDDDMPTMPFTLDEVKRLLAACDKIDNPNKAQIPRARLRARALVLLLLYSGLRISDAMRLRRSQLGADGRLLLRMMKTQQPLYVRLSAETITALNNLPIESEYFFWSGTAKLTTATGSARRTIDCIGEIAGVDAHPHRFRDTFSVELLRTGADLRTVQLLLGHTSLKTTEKHYAPFVTAFQSRLDEATSRLQFIAPVTEPANAGKPVRRLKRVS